VRARDSQSIQLAGPLDKGKGKLVELKTCIAEQLRDGGMRVKPTTPDGEVAET